MKADDLHQDPLMDLVFTKLMLDEHQDFQGKNLKGFIHGLSVFPFVTVCYTEKQLWLLHQLIKYNKDLTLHYGNKKSV